MVPLPTAESEVRHGRPRRSSTRHHPGPSHREGVRARRTHGGFTVQYSGEPDRIPRGRRGWSSDPTPDRSLPSPSRPALLGGTPDPRGPDSHERRYSRCKWDAGPEMTRRTTLDDTTGPTGGQWRSDGERQSGRQGSRGRQRSNRDLKDKKGGSTCISNSAEPFNSVMWA